MSDLRVLIADDDPGARAALRAALEHATDLTVVDAVADGESALNCLFEKSHLDLLITDLVLPGRVDGRVLVDAARRRRPALQVMVTSGYTKSGPYGELLDQYGDCKFLGKPFTNDELIAAVREACTAAGDATSAECRAADFAGCREQTKCDEEKNTHSR